MNPNYKPILYQEIIDENEAGFNFRDIGYPRIRDALPNTTHHALAILQHASYISRLITQNVDGLHHKALNHVWDAAATKPIVLELHGTLHKVECNHGPTVHRATFQDWLSVANPRWKIIADEYERTDTQPSMNPDGDVALEGVSYDDFVVPECPQCLVVNRYNRIHKPNVIFFGESVSPAIRDCSFAYIEQGSRLLIIGTTLVTYSAFRLVKHAVGLGKPVMHLNLGPSRTDGLEGVEKLDIASGTILPQVVAALIGQRASKIRCMVQNGIVQPPRSLS